MLVLDPDMKHTRNQTQAALCAESYSGEQGLVGSVVSMKMRLACGFIRGIPLAPQLLFQVRRCNPRRKLCRRAFTAFQYKNQPRNGVEKFQVCCRVIDCLAPLAVELKGYPVVLYSVCNTQ